jgi:FAD/FMN-containing dehydrogenase
MDNGYDSAPQIRNGMIDKKPGLIVQCAGAADIIAAVNFASEHNLLMSIRGGGRNVAGTAIAEDGLVIDLSQMRSVQVDPERRSARVEGGARLRDLNHETRRS